VLACSAVTLRLIAITTIGLATVARAALIHWHPDFATAHFLGNATLLRADPLAAGAVLALLIRERELSRDMTAAVIVTAAGTVASVVLLMLDSVGLKQGVVFVLREPFVAMAFAGALLIVLKAPPRWIKARWLTFLGTVSYGIYVIHGCLVPRFLHHVDRPSLRTLGLLGVSVPLAALSWRWFESPVLSLKRYWPMPSSVSGHDRVSGSLRHAHFHSKNCKPIGRRRKRTPWN